MFGRLPGRPAVSGFVRTGGRLALPVDFAIAQDSMGPGSYPLAHSAGKQTSAWCSRSGHRKTATKEAEVPRNEKGNLICLFDASALLRLFDASSSRPVAFCRAPHYLDAWHSKVACLIQ